MPVPSTIADLSTTASINSPQGTEGLNTTDDYIRALSAIVKTQDVAKDVAIALKANVANPVLTGLVDLSSPSSGQVKFPATQNSSSDANTLDDYEEGTFSPTFALTTPGTSSFTYASQQGVYTKIGRLVTYSIHVQVSAASVGTGTGNLVIGGLPFTAGTGVNFFGGAIAFSFGFAVADPTGAMISQSSNVISLYRIATGSTITQAHVGGTMDLYVSGSYIV